jgi:hypothetical protein
MKHLLLHRMFGVFHPVFFFFSLPSPLSSMEIDYLFSYKEPMAALYDRTGSHGTVVIPGWGTLCFFLSLR